MYPEEYMVLVNGEPRFFDEYSKGDAEEYARTRHGQLFVIRLEETFEAEDDEE